jgi:pimeloyl-ACP methyl ester carboxylesterase
MYFSELWENRHVENHDMAERSGSISRAPDAVEVGGPTNTPCLVFVHGAGISRQMWRPQLSALAGTFRVVAFDLPGHGVRGGERFDFEAAVTLLSDVVASHGGSPVVLVGHSLGGYIVAEYAARRPDRVSGIVLSGSSADYRGWLGFRTKVTAALYRLGGRISFVDRWFRDRTASQIRELPISQSTADAIIDGGFFLRSWGEAGAALVGRNSHERLCEYPGAVLLVNGASDTLNVPDAERLAAELPNVDADVIHGAGHLCNLQAPSDYTARVRAFAHEHIIAE